MTNSRVTEMGENMVKVVSNNIRVYQSNDILYEINRKKKKNMQCQDVKNIVKCCFLFFREIHSLFSHASKMCPLHPCHRDAVG